MFIQATARNFDSFSPRGQLPCLIYVLSNLEELESNPVTGLLNYYNNYSERADFLTDGLVSSCRSYRDITINLEQFHNQ